MRLTFDGHGDEVAANVRRIEGLVRQSGALEYLVLEDKTLTADIWRVRGALVTAVETISEQEPVDIVVPINRTSEFISYIDRLEQDSQMRMVRFGHAGDGNVHLCVLRGGRGEKEWKDELRHNMELAYAKAYELGGLTSGEHGIGISKRHYFLRETQPENINMMNHIKNALDKRHILNNQKSYIM